LTHYVTLFDTKKANKDSHGHETGFKFAKGLFLQEQLTPIIEESAMKSISEYLKNRDRDHQQLPSPKL
jgi:hypothetical protein